MGVQTMTWQLLALAGIGLWLLVAIGVVACALASSRADDRDELAELHARLHAARVGPRARREPRARRSPAGSLAQAHPHADRRPRGLIARLVDPSSPRRGRRRRGVIGSMVSQVGRRATAGVLRPPLTRGPAPHPNTNARAVAGAP
jgi:hypothetical protein